MSPMSHPQSGLSRVQVDPQLIPDGSIAFCTNYTAVTADLKRGLDALYATGLPITHVLTPEHGYWGAAQAGESDGDGADPATGLPVVDTYTISGTDLDELISKTGADQIVLDLQDIGTRFYTYTWTLFDLLCSAARTGQGVVVLDRPNPLGRKVTGPGLDPTYSSFVGRVSIPLQHGLTLGELARWFNAEHVPAVTGKSADLTVVEAAHWAGEVAPAGAPWVMPSPNMPTLDTAIVYPGTGLIEGTTLSEGRGTTRPFELFGAAWTDARLAPALSELDLPGLAVREAVFRPQFSKWAGDTVHGAQFHLLDAEAYDPIATGYAVLSTVARLYPDQDLWRLPPEGHHLFIDVLWGSTAMREGIDAGASLQDILRESPQAPTTPESVLLYPSSKDTP